MSDSSLMLALIPDLKSVLQTKLESDIQQTRVRALEHQNSSPGYRRSSSNNRLQVKLSLS